MVVMAGWGGLGGYIEDLADRRGRAGDPTDTSPGANLTRRACDWAARKGGIVAGAPHVQFACGPYWNNQPEYDPPEPSATESPFEGGQCPEVLYNVSWSYQIEGNPPNTGTLNGVRGPVGVQNTDLGGNPPGTQGRILQRVGTPNEQGFLIFSTSEPVASALSITSVVRPDGLPDDCGDPDPVTTNPSPRDVPPTLLPPDGSPVPIEDPNDPDDTTPPVTFPPTDTPYDPWIPIINPPPGFPPFVLPPSGSDDIPPREGPETDVPPGGTDGTDIPPPEPVIPSEVCIGYAFDFYSIPDNRGGIPGADPARYYEIFGSAQLKIETDLGEFYDLPVKIDSRRGVCYRSDESLKVIGLSLNSKVSFGPVRVKPIFVLREDKS